MSTLKLACLIGGMALLTVFAAPASRAGDLNQATKIHFNQPIRIPGKVLPAGTYWFTAIDGESGLQNAMQIRNARQTKLLAQLQTEVTDKSPEGGFVTVDGVRWPNAKVVVTLAEPQRQGPATLLDWYDPGRTDGHRLVYSSKRRRQLDEARHETIVASENGNR